MEPDLEILIRMADHFNTSVDYLIGHTDVRERIQPITSNSLNVQEAELINSFRSLTDDEKHCVETVVQTLKKR